MDMLDLEVFNFDLPDDLIALEPVFPRDECRLLVYDRQTKTITQTHFMNLFKFLRPHDLLVINDSSVVPARIYVHNSKGRKFELLFLEEALLTGQDMIRVGLGTHNPYKKASMDKHALSYSYKTRALLTPSSKVKINEYLHIDSKMAFLPLKHLQEGIFEGIFLNGDSKPVPAKKAMERHGNVPLPPYIAKRISKKTLENKKRWLEEYNPVYSKVEGSIAAPTAGLHFTNELLDKLSSLGIKVAKVCLHVGLGTFKPLRKSKLLDNRLDMEYFEISAENVAIIKKAREEEARIIAVGTTVVRVLESVVMFIDQPSYINTERGLSGYTDLFIMPGFNFRFIDGLITNFHLPKSSLILLVCAFAGINEVLNAYKEAIALGYRFYSFGDAMLIV